VQVCKCASVQVCKCVRVHAKPLREGSTPFRPTTALPSYLSPSEHLENTRVERRGITSRPPTLQSRETGVTRYENVGDAGVGDGGVMSPVDSVELFGCLGVTPCVLSADGEAECVAELG
jgi:hypothetical protein